MDYSSLTTISLLPWRKELSVPAGKDFVPHSLLDLRYLHYAHVMRVIPQLQSLVRRRRVSCRFQVNLASLADDLFTSPES